VSSEGDTMKTLIKIAIAKMDIAIDVNNKKDLK
jgi:hypothetical protein